MTCSLYTDTSTLNLKMVIMDMVKVKVNMATEKEKKKKIPNMAINMGEVKMMNKMTNRSMYSLQILGTLARLLSSILLQ